MKIKNAALIATIMVVVVAISAVPVSDEIVADAGSETGNVNVYYYDVQDQIWDKSPQNAYNLYLAVQGAMSDLGYTITTTSANTQWFKQESGYSNPNINYGLIEEINGSASFTIRGYNNSTSMWDDITDAPLGWLRPYADYSIVEVGDYYSVYANVAISAGNQDCSSIQDMKDPIDVRNNSSCLYSFQLYDASGSLTVPIGTQVKVMGESGIETVYLTSQMLMEGVTVYGYGSDAYLALKDAVGASLRGQTKAWINHGEYYTYYSWMDKLFNVGTSSEVVDGQVTYHYWASYDSNFDYLNWTLGYYSGMHFDADNVETSFTLMYM